MREGVKSKVKAVISVFFLSLGLVSPFYSELHQTRVEELSGSVIHRVVGIFLLYIYA